MTATTTLDELRARLLAQAEQEDLLDVAYDVVDSPVGDLLIAATPNGVVRVAFDTENKDEVLTRLAETVSPRVLAAPDRLAPVVRQIEEYLTGLRRDIDVQLDLQLAKGFRRSVLETLPTVRYGTTTSYAGLAALAGNERAVRAAASACSHNPVPIVLPCHRVVRTDGTFGGYLGGTERKQFLLTLEASA